MTEIRCDRCDAMISGHTMSWFSVENLCMTCDVVEHMHPDILKAKAADEANIGTNYKGIGTPPELDLPVPKWVRRAINLWRLKQGDINAAVIVNRDANPVPPFRVALYEIGADVGSRGVGLHVQPDEKSVVLVSTAGMDDAPSWWASVGSLTEADVPNTDCAPWRDTGGRYDILLFKLATAVARANHVEAPEPEPDGPLDGCSVADDGTPDIADDARAMREWYTSTGPEKGPLGKVIFPDGSEADITSIKVSFSDEGGECPVCENGTLELVEEGE